MFQQVFRSHRTALTELELCILDHLFYRVGELASIHLDMQLTVDYFAIPELPDILIGVAAMQEKAWIEKISTPFHGAMLGMTKLGFALWCEERQPQWDLFINHKIQLDKHRPMETWCVQSPNPLKILDFVEIAQKTGVMGRPKQQASIHKTEHYFWMTQYQALLNCPYSGSGGGQQEFESLRSWWSTIKDLQTVRKNAI